MKEMVEYNGDVYFCKGFRKFEIRALLKEINIGDFIYWYNKRLRRKKVDHTLLKVSDDLFIHSFYVNYDEHDEKLNFDESVELLWKMEACN